MKNHKQIAHPSLTQWNGARESGLRLINFGVNQRLKSIPMMFAISGILSFSTNVSAQVDSLDAIISSGVDTKGAVVFSVNTDGDGPNFFGVLVGKGYPVYGSTDTRLDVTTRDLTFYATDSQFVVQTMATTNGVFNTGNVGTQTLNTSGLATLQSASINATLGVTGTTTLNGQLDVRGIIRNTSTNGVVTFADAVKTANVGPLAANMVVNENYGVASLKAGNAGLTVNANNTPTVSLSSTNSGHGLTVVGTTSTVLKGGSNSGILTLQDGNTGAAGSVPAGTSVTISGSAGGNAATVFQTTTNANTTSVMTNIGTNAVYSAGSSATLQAGPSNAVSVNSGNVGAMPGVSINGVVGTGSNSTTGVLITGSGQNNEPYTDDDRAAGVTPTWADVAIQSKSYGGADPTLGSAILITDYGIQLISPQPIAGQLVTNNTGVNNSTGNMVNNNGMNASSGSVTNNTGGNSGSGSAINNIGMNTSTSGGVATNNIGGIAGNGTVNNGFGNASNTSSGIATNTIGQNNGTGVVNNSIGGGTGVTNNVVGNNNPQSSTEINGGSTRMSLESSGVSFSNTGTGGPVRLSGVADGSSPFDAANIRQVYGAVATSMATAPTVDLAPGESGIGVGTGYYGGYSAVGINFSHYSREGAQFSLAVAKGMQSGGRTAVRAGLGWKW